MPENNFQKQMTNPLERQIKDLLDLNIKTMQNFKFLNPTELMSTRNPSELFEKHVDLIIQNSHKTLDYLENIFAIMENNWLRMTNTALEQAQREAQNASSSMLESQKIIMKPMKKAVSKRVAKKAKPSSLRKKAVSAASAAKKISRPSSTVKKRQTKTLSSNLKKTDKKIAASVIAEKKSINKALKKPSRPIRLAKKTAIKASMGLNKKPATKGILAEQPSEAISKKA